MTVAQQTVLLGLVSGAFTLIGVIAYTESRAGEEREAVQLERYATAAATIVSGGILGALLLAMNASDDGLRGNVG